MTSGAPTYEMGRIILGRIFPDKDPYCFASFLIEIKLPEEYPFKRPDARIVDRMYHPDVEKGGMHASHWNVDFDSSWRPTSSLVDFIKCILKVINLDSNSIHYTNTEVGIEYQNHHDQFYEKALQCTLTYGRPR